MTSIPYQCKMLRAETECGVFKNCLYYLHDNSVNLKLY